MRRLFIFILIGFNASFAGKYTGDFLRIGVGARPAAMGGAFSAVANDATTFYWNPAGLTSSGRLALHIDHVAMFNAMAHYNVAGVSLSLKKRLAFGVSWIRLGVDDIPRYAPLMGTRLERLTGKNRSTGQPEGYFSDAEDAVIVSMAKKIPFTLGLGPRSRMLILPMELSLGANGKFIHHKLDQNAGSGQGLDAGVLLRAVNKTMIRNQPSSWLGMALMARDVSRTTLSWDTDSQHRDQMETTVLVGAAGSKYFRSFSSRLTVAVDHELMPFRDLHTGVELEILHTLALRAGIHNQTFSAGAGLQFKGLSLDYAFISHDLANSHRISGAFRF